MLSWLVMAECLTITGASRRTMLMSSIFLRPGTICKASTALGICCFAVSIHPQGDQCCQLLFVDRDGAVMWSAREGPFLAASSGWSGGFSYVCEATDGDAAECWGYVGPPPWGLGGLVTASVGQSHACGLYEGGSVGCCGDRSAGRFVCPGVHRKSPYLRLAPQRRSGVLGRQHQWSVGCTGGVVRVGVCRRGSFVRIAHRRLRGVLGQPRAGAVARAPGLTGGSVCWRGPHLCVA